MFIFTRRAMQQMIDAVTPWMPERALSELVARLNTPHTNRLPQMWELLWLYALGEVVPIKHENPLPSGRPDLWFTVSDACKSIQVVADITTISDAALDKANPFERLSEAVRQQACKAGLSGGGFHISVSHLEAGVQGSKKVKLLIPTGTHFDEIVRRHIKPFTQEVSAAPTRRHSIEVDEPGAKFSVRYGGPSQYSGGSHRAYDSVLSLENNALFNRLSDKTKQLRGAPEGAVRMLVVCDGDCALLGSQRPMEGFSAEQIAAHFLRKSTTIDIVLLVTVAEEVAAHPALRSQRYLRCTFVTSGSSLPSHLTAELIKALHGVVDQAVRKAPDPKLMPNNALRRNLDSYWSASMEGGYEYSKSRIKISARALLELLAGTMSAERFAEVHGWKENDRNMFRLCMDSGQLLAAARIESLVPSEDDDWIEFEFGYRDPAISEFRVTRGDEDSNN